MDTCIHRTLSHSLLVSVLLERETAMVPRVPEAHLILRGSATGYSSGLKTQGFVESEADGPGAPLLQAPVSWSAH